MIFVCVRAFLLVLSVCMRVRECIFEAGWSLFVCFKGKTSAVGIHKHQQRGRNCVAEGVFLSGVEGAHCCSVNHCL